MLFHNPENKTKILEKFEKPVSKLVQHFENPDKIKKI